MVTKHIDPLQVVLYRAGYADPAKGAFFFWDEVKDWPAGALEVLETSGLLQQAQPLTTIECDGCEENCINKPVVVYPAQEDKPGRAFIVCDEPNDLGRIHVSFDRMRQWQTTGGLIATVLARLLGFSQPSTQAADSGQWNIGMLKGKKHGSSVMLLADDGLALSLARHTAQLMDVLAIEKNAITLDKAALIRLVDNPAGSGKDETREARKARLISRVGEERAKGTRAFLQAVASEESLSVSRLKQIISGKPKSESEPAPNPASVPANPWSGLQLQIKKTSSKKTNPKY